MSIDFYYATITGWSILLFFWILILLFVYWRKPPESMLTFNMTVKSILIFVIGYIIILFLGSSIRF
jgi:hypothetical protein